jgi:hypothetical protein
MEEGIYIATFGLPNVPGFFSRGVVMLETNRFYGGDSFYYYTGRFEVTGDRFEAAGKVIMHTPGMLTIFGSGAPIQEIVITGTHRDGKVSGIMRLKASAVPEIAVQLEFRERLP